MIKRFLPIVLLVFLNHVLWSQITISASTFPQVGDTLTTVFDGVPAGVKITPPGPDQSWIFNKLQGLTRQSVFLTPADGKHGSAFPEADLCLKDHAGGERYITSTKSKYELVGFSGDDPVGLNLKVLTKISRPLLERKSPLKYKDKNSSKTEAALAFGADDLPRYLLDSLPITPDSIRLRIEVERNDEVDAWGVISIPGGDYEVLREKRIELRRTYLDTKISPLPWLDITELVLGHLSFVGNDTLINYYFHSDEAIEPIAILKVNPSDQKVYAVEYKANEALSNINYVNRGRADVFAYPNPAIEEVRFEFLNLKKGKYTLTIYNILGVDVWKEDFLITSDRTARVNLTDFRKGTYLYSLINERGKTITTKRLIILRP